MEVWLLLTMAAATEPLRVADLPFAEKLENPCALDSPPAQQQVPSSPAFRKSAREQALAQALLLRQAAVTILNTKVLRDCSALDLPDVATIPEADPSEGEDEALRLFYTSLLNHTAHVYFVSEQERRHATDDCNNSSLEESARSLAAHMRHLLCLLRFFSADDEPPPPQREDIFEEHLTDQPLCSRRSLRDCQTIASTVHLLNAFASYLQALSL